MKEINKRISFLFLGCIILFSFSCNTASIVNFESESFEKFKNECLILEENTENFYFARILTATCVDIVIFKFSKTNSFEEIIAKNIMIRDDNGNVIYKCDFMGFNSYESTDVINNCQYKIYSYEIPREEFDRITLKEYKTNFITLSFEINDIKYSEKLRRDEKTYLVLPT